MAKGTTSGPARSRLLLLADGRLPAGGYAHSGGLEPAVAAGHVRGLDDLAAFLRGRLRTTGLVTAAFAAAACALAGVTDPAGLQAGAAQLDDELDARMPSPAQRATSRQLGRQLLRATTVITPDRRLSALGRTPHQPVVLGVAHAVSDLAARDAALSCLHEIAAGPVAAAIRLLSLDPFAAHAVLAGLGELVDGLADEAVRRSGSVADLPASAAPLLDSLAEAHAARMTRLFAS